MQSDAGKQKSAEGADGAGNLTQPNWEKMTNLLNEHLPVMTPSGFVSLLKRIRLRIRVKKPAPPKSENEPL